MKLEKINTKYIVAEDIFPIVGNKVSEFFFFPNKESAKSFFNKKIHEAIQELNNSKRFKGFKADNVAPLYIKNAFALMHKGPEKAGYCLRYILDII